MSTLLIRIMQPEDAVKVADLATQLGYPNAATAISERIVLLLQQENDGLLVAVDHAGVIGWIHVYKTLRLESGAFAEIAALVVDEQHRGKRVGEQLLDAARDWCRCQHISRLKVRSNVTRTRAHRFYLNAGFKEKKESKVFEMEL